MFFNLKIVEENVVFLLKVLGLSLLRLVKQQNMDYLNLSV